MTNEELEEQTQALRQSEERLQAQQEELEQANAELEEKAERLEAQNREFEITNREVEEARAELEEKARQLAISSKYKSEFLANMSHELRTPLNSLLILSKLLSDNPGGNLQRLVDELKLFLNSDSERGDAVEEYSSFEGKGSSELTGKKILLVDDDVRNIYAISSILEQYGMYIEFAENGVESLDIINQDSTIDLVLMDIMMPEMDGYEAIRRIRENPEFKNLPIIALTAKAMKEDREKSLEAGASDYIMKPVDPDKLISLMAVWLYRQEGK